MEVDDYELSDFSKAPVCLLYHIRNRVIVSVKSRRYKVWTDTDDSAGSTFHPRHTWTTKDGRAHKLFLISVSFYSEFHPRIPEPRLDVTMASAASSLVSVWGIPHIPVSAPQTGLLKSVLRPVCRSGSCSILSSPTKHRDFSFSRAS